jgi:hypothetical protein
LTPDSLLNQANYRRGVLLLLSVGVKEDTARGLATVRPVGQIVDVVQAARRKSNPGGFAVDAIKKGWGVPEDPDARAEILKELEADRLKAAAKTPALMPKNPKYAQREGEPVDDWMIRVTEMKRSEQRAPSKR